MCDPPPVDTSKIKGRGMGKTRSVESKKEDEFVNGLDAGVDKEPVTPFGTHGIDFARMRSTMTWTLKSTDTGKKYMCTLVPSKNNNGVNYVPVTDPNYKYPDDNAIVLLVPNLPPHESGNSVVLQCTNPLDDATWRQDIIMGSRFSTRTSMRF